MAITFEKKERIAYVTINRPEVMNALNLESVKELSEALIEFRDDDELRVAIITGAGDKAFCAGADLKGGLLKFLMEEAIDKPWRLPPTIFRGLELWKPVIAAINGLAFGGGLELALACDLRVASQNAMFGTPEVALGALPGWGGTQRLARFVPRCKAAEILLLGLPIDAQEAYRIGLVNKVVPPAQVIPAAQEWAVRLCEVAPMAVKAIKEAMNRGADATLEEGLRLEWLLAAQLFASDDMQEGMRAFVEKRKPQFKGK